MSASNGLAPGYVTPPGYVTVRECVTAPEFVTPPGCVTLRESVTPIGHARHLTLPVPLSVAADFGLVRADYGFAIDRAIGPVHESKCCGANVAGPEHSAVRPGSARSRYVSVDGHGSRFL